MEVLGSSILGSSMFVIEISEIRELFHALLNVPMGYRHISKQSSNSVVKKQTAHSERARDRK